MLAGPAGSSAFTVIDSLYPLLDNAIRSQIQTLVPALLHRSPELPIQNTRVFPCFSDHVTNSFLGCVLLLVEISENQTRKCQFAYSHAQAFIISSSFLVPGHQQTQTGQPFAFCSSFISTVINTDVKATWEGKVDGFSSLLLSVSLWLRKSRQELGRAGTWQQEFMQRPWRRCPIGSGWRQCLH